MNWCITSAIIINLDFSNPNVMIVVFFTHKIVALAKDMEFIVFLGLWPAWRNIQRLVVMLIQFLFAFNTLPGWVLVHVTSCDMFFSGRKNRTLTKQPRFQADVITYNSLMSSFERGGLWHTEAWCGQRGNEVSQNKIDTIRYWSKLGIWIF